MRLQPADPRASFGVEVVGVDVRDLTETEVIELRSEWDEKVVLVFRDQELTTEDQIAFASRFGMLGDGGGSPPDAEGARGDHVMIIANREVDGKPGALPDGEMWFHYDQLYNPVPLAAGILYGIEIPPTGGDTLFANAVAGYDALPIATRDRLAGLEAQHIYDYRTTTARLTPDSGARSYTHPVVVRHPRTGRPVLYVARLMTHRIVGLDSKESSALLEDLFDHLEHTDRVYRHVWRKGDLVLWDNNAALHARTDFDSRNTRILRRVSLANAVAPCAYKPA